MTTKLYLSRARLRSRRGEALASIAPLLLPTSPEDRQAATHRIVWMLFQSEPNAGQSAAWRKTEQGFLWRDEGDGRFLILSRSRPTDPHGLFDLDSKDFEPELAAGDRLKFALRANPVRSSKAALSEENKDPRARGKRVDVVMAALKGIPKTDWSSRTGRAFVRDDLVRDTTREWLRQQGEKHGFELSPESAFFADGYSQVQVSRKGRGRAAGFALVDIKGELTVTHPDAFLARLPLGFGAAKAFGCGLMLIRRA